MNKTNISWTDATWNPVSGCQKVSEGCKFCYAETIAEKFKGSQGFPNGFEITLKPHKLKEPYKLKEPSNIFVNSMSDLFWEQIPADFRDEIVDIIEDTPQHEYQVLTKRPEAMLEYSKRRKLPANFWAGASIESNKRAYRIEIVRQIDVEIRFLSIEPLLERLNPESLDFSGIQWVITGGESGKHMFDAAIRKKRAMVDFINGKWIPKRECIDWIRDIRDACLKHNVKFFHKQWGGNYPLAAGRMLDGRIHNDIPTRGL